MRTRIIDDPGFILAGLATDTSQPSQAADAGPLVVRFFAPDFIAGLRGRIDPDETVALYANWNPAAETYRLMFGCAVAETDQPAGVEVVHVPPARYTVFTAVGRQPQASIEAWKRIALWRTEPDVVTTGAVSFEVHDSRIRRETPEVDIYVPAVRA
jgi:predicted transcriptional regulator YdeE